MHRKGPIGALAVITLTLVATAAPGYARVYVLPHVLEVRGSLTRSPGSFETFLHAVWAGDQTCAPGAADETVNIWAVNADGTPMQGAGGLPVCNPCTYTLGSGGSSTLTVSMTDLILAAGGLPQDADPDAFLLVETVPASGESSVGVSCEVKTHTGPGTFNQGPCPLVQTIAGSGGGGGGGGGGAACKTFVWPHILEKSGSVHDTPFTFDTTIFADYNPGLAGGTGDPTATATLDLYLFDQATGELLTDAIGTAVCAPCTTPLGGTARKESMHVEGLISAGGASIPPAGLVAVVIITGYIDDVALSAQTVASGELFDISVFGFEPVPISAPANLSAVQDVARRYAGLSSYPNPFNPMTTLAYTLPRGGEVTLRVMDVRGRVVRTLQAGVQSAGSKELTWDGRDDAGRALPSGTYLARLETADFATVQKMALLK